ncbi:acyl-CoA dehydrogenase family protein [Salinarimonas soli]|uniref:Acyl-CoA dehydrogenase family protein n=2 Tax=Salinarimonas soli TaxID=1638099 RepID=A0A5B2VT52_9HYPH|nr:acyl-CoA dehydrogenase family protein [Salinarimonas soli]
MLQEAARGFLSESAPVSQLRALRDARDELGYSRDLWRAMAELGWTGILIPEEHGGLDFGHMGAGLVCQEMGRTLAASPYISTAIMAATAIRRGGGPGQQARWLPAIAAGEAVIAVAVDEARKHDPAGTALRAQASCNGFRLDGHKTFVADAVGADAIIVAARTGGEPGEAEGLSLFVVDARAQGLDIERTLMVDSRNAARLTLDGVQVDEADALGPVGGAFELLETVLGAGRAGLAAEMSGIAQESFARTLGYLRERTQFGRPIGSFQALQHRAAHLYCEIEVAKSAVLAGGQALDRDPTGAGFLVSLAKAKAGEVARLAVAEAVQMHGGIGMTDAVDIGLFMKRARVAGEWLGDASFHAGRIARLRCF